MAMQIHDPDPSKAETQDNPPNHPRNTDTDIDTRVGADARGVPESTDDAEDREDTGEHRRPTSFRERHALKVMGIIMGAMLALVIAVQVGC